MSITTRNNISSLEKALFGVFIGDAFGAGWEMKSRQYILDHFKELDEKYRMRYPEFGINFKEGKYTDDAEMTLAVLYALKDGNGTLSKESLVNWFIKVYEENEKTTGFRDGYGSFKNVMAIKHTNPLTQKEQQLLMVEEQRKNQATKEPGNGALMRIMPALFYSKKNRKAYNAIVNSLATHPHPLSVFGSLAIMYAGSFLFWKKGNPDQLISQVLRKLDRVLNNLSEYKEEKKLLQNDQIYPFETQYNYWNKFKAKLEKIDQMVEPIDDICSNLTNIDFDFLMAPYAKPCKGGIGLSAKAEHTTYCVLYLLKWSANTTIYSTLKRCVTMGGDTDSLASIVLGYLMLYKDLEKPIEELFPTWTVDQLEGKDIIENVLRDHHT